MTKLPHLDSSSVSRQLSAAIVARLRQTASDLDVVPRDLAAIPLSHLSGAHLAVAQGGSISDPALDRELATGQAVLDEFLAVDTVVIGAPTGDQNQATSNPNRIATSVTKSPRPENKATRAQSSVSQWWPANGFAILEKCDE